MRMQTFFCPNFEADRRDALCGWYVCSGVSKSDKVWSSILSKELSGRQM